MRSRAGYRHSSWSTASPLQGVPWRMPPRASAPSLSRSCGANIASDLIERHAAALNVIGSVKLLEPEPAQVRDQTAAAIVLQIEDRAVASNERLDIGDV